MYSWKFCKIFRKAHVPDKVVGLNTKRLQHRCFLANFCEILKNTYSVEYLQRLFFPIASSAVETFFKFICILAAFAKLLEQKILLLHLLHRVRNLDVTYSTSDSETPPISRVLIGRHLRFCWLTSPLASKMEAKSWFSNCHIKTFPMNLAYFLLAQLVTCVVSI